eukprot:TRINITY_DN16253_c0_g1_i1.p1 TRINITY_DN16253_c0_g1~~TRINITY_DN16253_c0_g1_i1.p1  ORF type:complete len:470 (+),score=90.98 TRINITY_DN16253_c0_g1_i1:37-1446(+)
MNEAAPLISRVQEVEVLKIIARYLDVLDKWRLGLVCRAFREVSRQDPYERVVLKEERECAERRSTAQMIQVLLSVLRVGGCRVLNVDGLKSKTMPHHAMSKHLLDTVWHHSSETLESLSLRFFPTLLQPSEPLKLINLKTLNLRGCKDAPVSFILQHCTALTELDLRGCPEMGTIDGLMAYVPSGLRRLSIGWDSEFQESPDAINDFYNSPKVVEMLKKLAVECSSLSSLEVPGFACVQGDTMQDMRSLTSLDVCNCSLVSDSLATVLRDNSFQHLNLRVTGITDSIMQSIALHCKGLKSLNVSCTMISDVGLAAVAEGCPVLQSIDLCYPEGHVTEKGILTVCRTYGKDLRMLGIAGLQGVVTDELLAEAVALCPSMRCLAIGGNHMLTAEIWGMLRQLKCLKRVVAHGLEFINYEEVLRLAECTNLQQLDLYNVLPNPTLTLSQLNILRQRFPFDWRNVEAVHNCFC